MRINERRVLNALAWRSKNEKSPFPGQLNKVLTTPFVILAILIVLFLGGLPGLWAFASEASSNVTTYDNCLSLQGNGFARNERILFSNLSYLPIDGVWKISYNYTGPGIVQSDTESFHIPAQGTTSVKLTFTGVGPEQIGRVSSEDPVVKTFVGNYHTMLWTFKQESQFEFDRGPLGPSFIC